MLDHDDVCASLGWCNEACRTVCDVAAVRPRRAQAGSRETRDGSIPGSGGAARKCAFPTWKVQFQKEKARKEGEVQKSHSFRSAGDTHLLKLREAEDDLTDGN